MVIMCSYSYFFFVLFYFGFNHAEVEGEELEDLIFAVPNMLYLQFSSFIYQMNSLSLFNEAEVGGARCKKT